MFHETSHWSICAITLQAKNFLTLKKSLPANVSTKVNSDAMLTLYDNPNILQCKERQYFLYRYHDNKLLYYKILICVINS